MLLSFERLVGETSIHPQGTTFRVVSSVTAVEYTLGFELLALLFGDFLGDSGGIHNCLCSYFQVIFQDDI